VQTPSQHRQHAESAFERDAFRYADMPVTTLDADDIEDMLAGLRIEANGHRRVTTLDGEGL
jgi:hypothetical protein